MSETAHYNGTGPPIFPAFGDELRRRNAELLTLHLTDSERQSGQTSGRLPEIHQEQGAAGFH
jgi:hypothetical protein